MHKAIAELVISEDKYQGEFEMKTYFSGWISMKTLKDGKEVLSFDFNDLEDLFLSSENGFIKDQNGFFSSKYHSAKTSRNNTLYFIILSSFTNFRFYLYIMVYIYFVC